MIELGNIVGNEISVIKDPFDKELIEGVQIIYMTNLFGKKYWFAIVEFKNGHTTGKQRTPDCDTFEEVYAQLKLILDSVRNK